MRADHSKNDINELIYKMETDSQTEKKNPHTYQQREREAGVNWELD